jgi:hypothetical protein
MAYLRPLNSSEANLFIIRFTTPNITYNNLSSVSNNYYKVDTTIYDNPTSDLLPSDFGYYLGNSTAQDYLIKFGTMTNAFTEPPTVLINIAKNPDSTISDIDTYNIILGDITTTTANFSIRNSAATTDTKITPYDGASNNTGLTAPKFNILIIGSVMSGATFAISNRGWNVPASNPGKLYTYQSVGIGTGKIDGTLNLKGTLVSPAYIVTYDNSSVADTIKNNIISNYITIMTIAAGYTGTNTITLPTGSDGQIIKITITNSSNLSSGSLTLDSLVNGVTSVILASTTTYRTSTELYYNKSAGGWILLK